jgi:hypothetical protein
MNPRLEKEIVKRERKQLSSKEALHPTRRK